MAYLEPRRCRVGGKKKQKPSKVLLECVTKKRKPDVASSSAAESRNTLTSRGSVLSSRADVTAFASFFLCFCLALAVFDRFLCGFPTPTPVSLLIFPSFFSSFLLLPLRAVYQGRQGQGLLQALPGQVPPSPQWQDRLLCTSPVSITLSFFTASFFFVFFFFLAAAYPPFACPSAFSAWL